MALAEVGAVAQAVDVLDPGASLAFLEGVTRLPVAHAERPIA